MNTKQPAVAPTLDFQEPKAVLKDKIPQERQKHRAVKAVEQQPWDVPEADTSIPIF